MLVNNLHLCNFDIRSLVLLRILISHLRLMRLGRNLSTVRKILSSSHLSRFGWFLGRGSRDGLNSGKGA